MSSESMQHQRQKSTIDTQIIVVSMLLHSIKEAFMVMTGGVRDKQANLLDLTEH